ncbi:Acyltransferase [Chitinispirillum alkaliphilum]|nr:Acyltransferase [Chitinispirillum alkaliphilum]
MNSTLYLCGAGNPEGVRLALRINEREKRWKQIVILDDDTSKKGKKIMGLEVAGPFELLKTACPQEDEVANLIARTTARRKDAYEKIGKYGIPFAPLIDTSVDTRGVEWRGDVMVYQNVVFSAGAFLDQGSVVFTGGIVGHGCSIGSFCVVAPGAVLNARVRLGDGVYVGTNASILPDLEIGEWATIGLNTGVMENVPPNATAIGVPAQIICSGSNREVAKMEKSTDKEETQSKESLERLILDIWCDVLKLDKIGIDDNFFDSGGTSQLAVQAHSALVGSGCSELTLIEIFQFPTARCLAETVLNKNISNGKQKTVTTPQLSGDLFQRRRQARMQT